MNPVGFWSSDQALPDDPAAEIRRREEIQRELAELREENRF